MRNIFCLETEWVQNAHDLKKKSSVQSMLEFFETSSKVDRETDVVHHIFRKVATKSDFEYYLFHLWHDSYANYDTIYLCFHGLPGQIFFADGNKVELKEMAFDANYENIFANKRVHFGCCYTLKEKQWYLRYVLKEDCDSENIEELWNKHFEKK